MKLLPNRRKPWAALRCGMIRKSSLSQNYPNIPHSKVEVKPNEVINVRPIIGWKTCSYLDATCRECPSAGQLIGISKAAKNRAPKKRQHVLAGRIFPAAAMKSDIRVHKKGLVYFVCPNRTSSQEHVWRPIYEPYRRYRWGQTT